MAATGPPQPSTAASGVCAYTAKEGTPPFLPLQSREFRLRKKAESPQPTTRLAGDGAGKSSGEVRLARKRLLGAEEETAARAVSYKHASARERERERVPFVLLKTTTPSPRASGLLAKERTPRTEKQRKRALERHADSLCTADALPRASCDDTDQRPAAHRGLRRSPRYSQLLSKASETSLQTT